MRQYVPELDVMWPSGHYIWLLAGNVSLHSRIGGLAGEWWWCYVAHSHVVRAALAQSVTISPLAMPLLSPCNGQIGPF
jgi:hypothetical protein